MCDALIQKHGAGNAAAIEKGVQQAARLWRFSDPPIVVRSNRDLNPHVYDGDFNDFRNFCEKEFLPPGPARDATFERLENMFESLDGSFNAIRRDLHRGADLEIGPMLPIDERLGAFDASAHLDEDLYQSKIAFIVLLNFPLTTLGERLEHGMQWSRDDWAKARIARRFETRTPAEVNQAVAIAVAEAESYIAGYNIYMHRLVGEDGQHLFPEGLRLITHWGLRDELKARYADPQGLAKQRMIQKVMERIVTQTIPRAMVDGDKADWDPYKNTVAGAESPREPDTRYARWKGIFDANRMADAYDLDCPTYVQRKFEREREIPEKEVERLFLNLLESPLTPRVAAMIEKKLGRGLEPFDIWYAGFRPLSKYSEADLDAKTRAKYPNPRAYAADMPRLFVDLGFREEKARFLAGNIIVDPSRGAGHALGAQRRDDKAHLRTRFGEKGMDYKGYNIAIHEMGHNVEQSFSMTTIDHTSLSGVPNTAFTEALAFVFQARDLELLGLEKPDAEAVHAKALEDFWAAREIAGVALVDTAAWHWLYNHPAASPAEFREAVVTIANDVWNRYYAQYLGAKDVPILAVYSHMVDAGLYTPDYPLGHLIAFQIEEHFKKKEISSQLNQPLPKNFGDEFERVAKIGSLTPDAWMRTATGGPLSTEPLLTTAARAADYFENKK
ncbi:MAG: hypothetical protein HY286_13715 [Planctomycetes bacterium]|nr:hypothetical protein [Planctomycetota bacterium]